MLCSCRSWHNGQGHLAAPARLPMTALPAASGSREEGGMTACSALALLVYCSLAPAMQVLGFGVWVVPGGGGGVRCYKQRLVRSL